MTIKEYKRKFDKWIETWRWDYLIDPTDECSGFDLDEAFEDWVFGNYGNSGAAQFLRENKDRLIGEEWR